VETESDISKRRVLFERPSEAGQVDPNLTLEQCIERRAEISRALSDIAEIVDTIGRQLAAPRPDGDPAWASRAEAARKHYKRKSADHERAYLNLTQRVAMLDRDGVSHRFVRAARDLLPLESYREIWAAVGEGAQ
jgi:hypothetical protein